MTAAAGTTGTVAGETTLNSLIMRVIFREITLSDSRATVETLLIMTILTGLMHSKARCPYPLALTAFSN